jgi:geranylgeranyl pyrophosphate synthase
MIHTASLIHDDVIDSSDRRRGKPAAAIKWGPKKVRLMSCYISIREIIFQAVLAGDYILGISSMMLARIGNSDVISLLSRVIQDLVRGTFFHLFLRLHHSFFRGIYAIIHQRK